MCIPAAERTTLRVERRCPMPCIPSMGASQVQSWEKLQQSCPEPRYLLMPNGTNMLASPRIWTAALCAVVGVDMVLR